jgi:hypothetical protein
MAQVSAALRLRGVTRLIILCAALFGGGSGAAHAQNACAAAPEYLNYIKEKLALSPSPQLLEKVFERVKFVTDNCPQNGDAWYYRSLIEQKLNKAKGDVSFSYRKAESYDAPALKAGLNPFLTREPREQVVENLSPTVRDKWALVVGVSTFKNLQQSARLKYAAKDAKDFASALTDPNYGRFKPDNVQVLTDEQATLEGIRTGLGWLRENAKRDDMVVIYFSSHGSSREMDPNGVSFIIAHDTAIDQDKKRYKLFATSLEMIYLVHFINRELQAQRTVLFLDTCYSGDATVAAGGAKSLVDDDKAESFSEALKALSSGVGHAVITSSQADERSWENDSLSNSIFTYHLIQELRNSKGAQTLDQLSNNLRARVSAEAQKMKRDQHPVMQLSRGAEKIVLGVQPQGR